MSQICDNSPLRVKLFPMVGKGLMSGEAWGRGYTGTGSMCTLYVGVLQNKYQALPDTTLMAINS